MTGPPSVPLTDDVFRRAIAVQGELARSGQHRLPIPDLVVAAGERVTA